MRCIHKHAFCRMLDRPATQLGAYQPIRLCMVAAACVGTPPPSSPRLSSPSVLRSWLVAFCWGRPGAVAGCEVVWLADVGRYCRRYGCCGCAVVPTARVDAAVCAPPLLLVRRLPPTISPCRNGDAANAAATVVDTVVVAAGLPGYDKPALVCTL